MFNLDSAIAEWRRQMAAAGIITSEALNELEAHLRDDVGQQIRSGLSEQQALEAAVRQMGQAAALKCEFDKIGATTKTPARMKRLILTLAGVPNHHLNTPMNTSTWNIEPRWATYVRAAAFLAPAVLICGFVTVFLFPKVQEICRDAGVGVPLFLRVIMGLIEFLRDHGILVCGTIFGLLTLLEWRFGNWPRYRRMSISAVVFLLNAAVLVVITGMFTVALLAAPALFHTK